MRSFVQSPRKRLAAGALLGAVGCILGLGALPFGAAGASSAGAVININYTSATTIQVKLDNGTVVGSGSVIPAGSYTVQVFDSDDQSPKITVNGPGVAISSDLNSTGMGIDLPSTFGPFTFQTSSAYVVQDTNLGASSRISFSTSATATAGGSTTTTAQSSTSGVGTTTTTKITTTVPPVAKSLGTLKGSVSVAGKPAITFNGKTVKSLKAGHYKVSVSDKSKTVGLIVWKLGSRAMTLSAAGKVGASSRAVTLSAGRWFFETSTKGPKTFFTVTA
ncbi:MAG TPA: hypothetical protein VGM80_00630 [Gaiellaceae bacterium]